MELARFNEWSLNAGVGEDRISASLGYDISGRLEAHAVFSLPFDDISKPRIGIGLGVKF